MIDELRSALEISKLKKSNSLQDHGYVAHFVMVS